MTEDRCICCGEVIPEGRQICIMCEVSIDNLTEDHKTEE